MNAESNLPYQRLPETNIQLANSSSLPSQTQPQPQSQLQPQPGPQRQETLRRHEALIEKIKDSKNTLKDQILKAGIIYKPSELRNSVESVMWNFDDSKIAVACRMEHIFVWDVKSNELIKTIEKYEIGNIAWHPKKNIIAYLSSQTSIKFYDIEADSEQSIDLINEVGLMTDFFLCWHPKGEVIAYNNGNKQIEIHNLKSVLKTIVSNFKKLKDLKWSLSGDKIAYCGENTLIIWDNIEDRELLKIQENPEIEIDNINWLKNDHKITFLCASKTNKRIMIWNIEEECEEMVFGSISEVISIDWSPDERFIVAGNKENTLTIWDAYNFIEIMSISTQNREIKSVKWNNSGSSLAVHFKESVLVHGWNTNIDYEPRKQKFESEVSKVKWSENGDKLLICFDYICEIWDSKFIKREFQKEFDSDLKDAILDKNSEQLICLTEEDIYYHNFKDNVSNSFEYENECDIHIMRYNNECSLIAGGGNQKIVIMSVDAKIFKEIKVIFAHSRNIVDVRWNMKGSQLLSSSRDGTLKIWEFEFEADRQSIKSFTKSEIKKHIGYVHSAFWDESENHIISVGVDQFIRIFKSENRNEIRSINIKDENIRQLGWFTFFDEKLLICLSTVGKNSIRIFDFKTGFQLKSLVFNFEENNKKQIKYMDTNITQKEIALAHDKSVLIYDNSKIWKDFESYEYLYFLIDYLSQIKKLNKKNSELVERIINYFFFEDAPSAFHILAILKLQDEFDLLIKFCLKNQLYPKKFFDNKNFSLFKFLNDKMRLSSIDLFFDFAIASDVQLGNLFHVTFEELKNYTKRNSHKVYRLLENRFRSYENEKSFAKWSSDDIESSSDLISDYNNIDIPKFEKDKIEILERNQNERTSNESNEDQDEKACFKILDIPIEELGLDFIQQLPKYNSFDEFCTSQLFISILDILWKNGVLRNFLIINSYYFLYFIILIINSIIILPNLLIEIERHNNDEHTGNKIIFLTLSIFLFFLLANFIWREISEYNISKNEYWKSFWNYVDWANIILSLACNIFNIIIISGATKEYGWLRVFHSICFFFSMIRIFDFFRAIKKTCFLIETVLQVVYDMKIFVFLMTLFISTFSLSSKKLYI